jgi:hypothetical protein
VFLGQILLGVTGIDRFLEEVLGNKPVELGVHLEF